MAIFPENYVELPCGSVTAPDPILCETQTSFSLIFKFSLCKISFGICAKSLILIFFSFVIAFSLAQCHEAKLLSAGETFQQLKKLKSAEIAQN